MDVSKFVPRGKWVLVQRIDENPTKLALPESAKQGMQSKTMVRVQAKGPDCDEDYAVDSRVVIAPQGAQALDSKNGWLLVHDDAILGVVR